jgi:hypothetical protein
LVYAEKASLTILDLFTKQCKIFSLEDLIKENETSELDISEVELVDFFIREDQDIPSLELIIEFTKHNKIDPFSEDEFDLSYQDEFEKMFKRVSIIPILNDPNDEYERTIGLF